MKNKNIMWLHESYPFFFGAAAAHAVEVPQAEIARVRVGMPSGGEN